MGRYQQPEGLTSSGSGSSSLERVLQQAWLQSQRPKVPKRSAVNSDLDVAVEKRACLTSRPAGACPGGGNSLFALHSIFKSDVLELIGAFRICSLFNSSNLEDLT